MMEERSKETESKPGSKVAHAGSKLNREESPMSRPTNKGAKVNSSKSRYGKNNRSKSRGSNSDATGENNAGSQVCFSSSKQNHASNKKGNALSGGEDDGAGSPRPLTQQIVKNKSIHSQHSKKTPSKKSLGI